MVRLIRLAWISTFAVWAASCVSTTEDGGPVASLELGFELADGSQVDEVVYSITGNRIDPIEGVINTRAPGSTGSVEVFGIPPGTRYLVTRRATTVDGETTCGGSTRFDVSDDVATEVQVMLGCKRGARFGGVRINGELNVCAQLSKVITSQPVLIALVQKVNHPQILYRRPWKPIHVPKGCPLAEARSRALRPRSRRSPAKRPEHRPSSSRCRTMGLSTAWTAGPST